MADFTYAQLEQLWINNGGSKATAPVAAAIAMAESSGNPLATSANPDGGTNVGLWQLDTPGGVGAGYSQGQLTDPNINAAVAVKGSSDGSNWSDWQTYSDGAYKRFLNAKTTPDPNVPQPGSGASSSPSASACLIGPLPHTSFCLLSKSQARALTGGALMAAGGLTMALGVALMAAFALGHSGAAKTAAGVLSGVPGPGAKAAAAIKRKSAPGRPLTEDEIKQAKANKKKLDEAKKKSGKT